MESTQRFVIPTLQSIQAAFIKGKKNYLGGDAEDPRQDRHFTRYGSYVTSKSKFQVTNKNTYSLGSSYLYRYLKARSRLNELGVLSEQNAATKLCEFLRGSGGADLLSFKYQVLSALTGVKKQNDQNAAAFVNFYTQELETNLRIAKTFSPAPGK